MWTTFDKLANEDNSSNKKYLVDVYTEWCGWCKVMDKKTFTDAAVINYLNQNYYAVKLNFDSPQKFNYLGKQYTAKELAKANGITGLPTMLVASADFKTVERIVGYQKPKQFISKLKKLEAGQ